MAGNTAYRIIMTERWTYLNAQHNPVDGYRITFELPDGIVDHIQIPESQLDPDIVGPLIEEKVLRHDAVNLLSS